jgi:iron transport multicopper oxidase
VSTPTGPTNLATIGSYSYVGCYTEATTGRALTGKAYANDNMTIEICYAQCAGYTWFGLEYHRECESSRVAEWLLSGLTLLL